MRKSYPAIIFLSIVFVVIFFVVRDVLRMSYNDNATSSIQAVSTYVEKYNQDQGSYPKSLENIFSSSDGSTVNNLGEILSNRYHDRWTYQLLTNGYIISVTNEHWPYSGKIREQQFGFDARKPPVP